MARRWRDAAGIWGPSAFAAAAVIGGRRQPGYSHSRQHVSGLAAQNTRSAVVMLPGFVAYGAASLVAPADGTLERVLLRVAGTGTVLAGLARCSDVRCPDPTRDPEATPADSVHAAVSILTFVAWTSLPFVEARRASSAAGRVLATANGAVTAVCFVAAGLRASRDTARKGVAQRAFLGSVALVRAAGRWSARPPNGGVTAAGAAPAGRPTRAVRSFRSRADPAQLIQEIHDVKHSTVRRAVAGGLATTVALAIAAPAVADQPIDSSACAPPSRWSGITEHLLALQDIAVFNDDNRASGTPGYDESAEYVAGMLEAAGYTVTIQPFSYERFTVDVATIDSPSPAVPDLVTAWISWSSSTRPRAAQRRRCRRSTSTSPVTGPRPAGARPPTSDRSPTATSH